VSGVKQLSLERPSYDLRAIDRFSRV
jgi:hypothetical protein